ncbi:hypothetical protein ACWGH4_00475 [Streptomyces sp. NPDC054847]
MFQPGSSHRMYALAIAPIAAMYAMSPSTAAAVGAAVATVQTLREILARRKP